MARDPMGNERPNGEERAQGKIVERLGAPSDIPARKQAEQALLESKAQADRQRRLYEGILNNTPDLAYVFDLDHRFIYANEGLLRMWGKSWDEAVGKTCLELGYEPWHAAMHDREIDQVVRTRQPVRGEVPFSGTYGRRIYDYIFVPVFGPAGDVEAIAGTTRDVTEYRNLVIERDRASDALLQSEAALRESNRRKDEFIATLSHELRNPLAPLRNALQLLRLAGDAGGPAVAVQEMMERQVNHLVRLVDDLLEMSRIDRGALELLQERVELSAIVRNALETSQPLVQSAGHILDVSLPAGPVWIEGDSVRLAQILANLLNNAAKYTEAGGRIALRAGVRDGIVSISVRDNGAGIAPETLPQLFGMFSRVGPASSRAQGGLGIGLALARRLASMHGGDIEARSEGLGKGSEFIVRLPVSTDQAPASSERTSPAAALPQQRILVVDDNRDAADSLGMLLKFLGADVRIARDGSEALEQFEAYDPRIVLLDIGMPGMDGYEVARRIRTGFPEHGATLVAVTGWGQEKDRRLAKEAGFDQHIIKPPEIGALRALLAALA